MPPLLHSPGSARRILGEQLGDEARRGPSALRVEAAPLGEHIFLGDRARHSRWYV
jgi:hypothetical protein